MSIERTGSYNRALYNDTCRGLKVVFVKANRMEASDSSPLRFNAATTMTSPNGNVSVSGGRVNVSDVTALINIILGIS